MNYQDTINWLFNQLPMYQSQGISAYKEDLSNTILLCNYLGNPEKNLTCIHVAGTNGKGSTSSMLASILQEAGYKVGLFTSPHLKDFRERIKINGAPITQEFVCKFVNDNLDFFKENELSFFEMTVGLAFDYFAKQKTDINIIEVGLGGRLDATNIITPLISVITNIGLDHTQILGNTLSLIATEKAGIIKPNVPVVIGEYTAETKNIFIEKAKQNNALLYFTTNEITEIHPSDLQGNYQVNNIKTATQTIKVLQSQKVFSITEQNIKDGFLNVIKNTGLQGRWQQINSNPKAICDTAHNAHGLKQVVTQILKEQFNQLHIVLGFVNDKDLDEILPLFPTTAKYYFCKPNITRGLDAIMVKNEAAKHQLFGNTYNSVQQAYKAALKHATTTDLIYIGGSTFVVAEIL
jgi:dihydrofolate synthase / folylpolyglutamate synthase